MKFLIAGLGSIGRRHLRNLLALGERDILLYRTHHSTLPDADLEGFPVESDLQAALAHRPDGVIVSNPSALHLEVAVPAAEAGCHLLLEKPISHSMDGIDRLQAALRGGGGQLLVGYQFRFHPGLQKAASLLSEGAIGRPLSVHAHWGEYLPGWHLWEDYRLAFSARASLGGGVVLTLSHPLDYLRWLLGEVESLWAFAGRLGDLDLDVEDNAEIGLRFTQGVTGSLHLDYNQQPSEHTLEIIGTHGTLRWDSTDGAASLYAASHASEQEKWQVFPISAITRESNNFKRNDLFLAELRHFLQVMRGEAEPVCSLWDGIQALRLALGALQSARDGCLIRLQAEARA